MAVEGGTRYQPHSSANLRNRKGLGFGTPRRSAPFHIRPEATLRTSLAADDGCVGRGVGPKAAAALDHVLPVLQASGRAAANARDLSERPSPTRVVKLDPQAAARVREFGHSEPQREAEVVNRSANRERHGSPQVLVARLVGGASWGVWRSRKGRAARRRPLRFWLPTPNLPRNSRRRSLFEIRANWLSASSSRFFVWLPNNNRLRNYLKRAHFADSHQWTLWKGAADGQDETSGETAANDLAGTG